VRQEKLAVLGQMAGSVGHELRNPLGVINTTVYYLKMVQPDVNEKIKEKHAIIEEEVHKADKIIGDLLGFARVITAEPEQVPVEKLVRQTLEHFPIPNGIKVLLDLPKNLPEVFADPRQVEQVLGNLVTNGCQAMDNSGQLSVSSDQMSENTKQWVRISVTDTGTGISPENMKKLFEPLFTTKTQGIGLGLAVSRKLAEANGGRIEVESEPGKGSIFTLYLPTAGGQR
jgi:signal transduction histidine kinase